MRAFLVISLVANTVLAGWFGYRLWHGEPQPASNRLRAIPTVVHDGAGPQARGDGAQTGAAIGSFATPLPVRWEEIASDDPRVYCRNLRALGCPEEVVREVIVQQVNRDYWTQVLPLIRQSSARFWDKTAVIKTSRKVEVEGEAEIRRGMNKLWMDRRSLFLELFDDDWGGPPYDDFDNTREGKMLFSFLPADKVAKAMEWEKRREEAMMTIYRQNLPEPERDVLLAWTRADLETEGRTVFTPDEWEEYQVRTSKSAYLPGTLYGVELSAEEMRALVRIQEAHGEKDKSPALQAEIKALLGERRFADFQRSQDRGFQDLYRVALRLDLPKEAALTAYQTRQAVEQAAREIRASERSLPEAVASLHALRIDAEARLLSILGQTGFETYQRNGAWWLQSLERAGEE